jgi:uncharacterized membrane protein
MAEFGSLPPLPYLVGLLAIGAVVAGVLWWRRPRISERVVVALVPWMLVGAGLRTLPQVGAAPEAVEPLLGTTSVYLTTFGVVGAVWAAVDYTADERTATFALGGSGLVGLLVVVAAAVAGGPTLEPFWPVVAVGVALLVTAVAWVALRWYDPGVTEVMPLLGPVVVFGHALDGVSTSIGVDVLGFGEVTPTSRYVLEFAKGLPTAEYLGAGWLFVVIKLFAAGVIVHLFVNFVREEGEWSYLLLGVAGAVGLGPGAHNVLLYAVVGTPA